MARSWIGDIYVGLTANPKGFLAGMDKAQRKTQDFRSGMERVNKSLDLIVGGGAAAVAVQAARMMQQMAAQVSKLREEFAAGQLSVADFTDGLLASLPVFGEFYKAGRSLREIIFGVSQATRDLAKAAEEAKAGELQDKIFGQLAGIRGKLAGTDPAEKARIALEQQLAPLAQARREVLAMVSDESQRAKLLEEIAKTERAIAAEHENTMRQASYQRGFEARERREKAMIERMKAEQEYYEQQRKAEAERVREVEKRRAEIEKQYEDIKAKITEARKDRGGFETRLAQNIEAGSVAEFRVRQAAIVAQTGGYNVREQIMIQRDQLAELRRIARNLEEDLAELPAA